MDIYLIVFVDGFVVDTRHCFYHFYQPEKCVLLTVLINRFIILLLIAFCENDFIYIITADSSGRIRLFRITRSFFGKYSHVSSSLYESTFDQVQTIEVQQPNSKMHPSAFCDQTCLTAIGGANTVTIVKLRPFPA